MISIVTVNYNGREWIELLVKSVRKFTVAPHELVVVDNASEDGSQAWLEAQRDVRLIALDKNVGHGAGLDYGIAQARMKYVLVLDSDAHLQRPGWEDSLIDFYQRDAQTRLIAAAGGDPNAPNPKPIHACLQFFEREFFIDNKLSFVPSQYDVGRKNYYDVIGLGYNVVRIPAGRKSYPGSYGDTYYVDGKPTLYHHWYSSRMYRVPAGGRVDNYEKRDFEAYKHRLFSEPLVREILA